jgi:methyl-accepting chemotaxis protein WspA
MFDSLMSRLSIQAKILLLLTLFAFPLGTLGFYAISIIRANLEIVAAELRGAEEAATLYSRAYNTPDPRVAENLFQQFYEIGTRSGLTLDPDLDSYELQKALTTTLPAVAVQLMRTRHTAANPADHITARAVTANILLPQFFESLEIARRADEQYYGMSPNLQALLTRHHDSMASDTTILLAPFLDPKAFDAALDRIETISSDLLTELQALLMIRRSYYDRQLRNALVATGLALVLLPLVSWVIIRNISVRLARLSEATQRVAHSGDLSCQVSDQGHDEIFSLSSSLNLMVRTLRGVVRKIQESGSLITTSVAEIASVSKQQQATSSEIAATTTEIEATSKQIARTSENLAQNMQSVQEVSNTAATLAEEGQESLVRMRATMHSIQDAATVISQKLETLNNRASRIGEVVVTIAKVADQTNLLSLNAAIEAERAGEFGQGFAVVAREIRRLADQTASSTVDIEQIIKEIQSAVAAGVMGMERFTNEVVRGVTDVTTADQQLSRVIEQIQTLSPTFHTVTEGMNDQVIGARQITESLSQLSTAIRQTADSLTQSHLSIEQLHQAALMLDQEVDRFNLQGA